MILSDNRSKRVLRRSGDSKLGLSAAQHEKSIKVSC